MNDRFKFRCFSKKTKKMYEVDSLHLDSENEWVWVHYYNPIYDKDLKIQIETPNAVIMQCTGLKDKNGKLIYEGDIINDKSNYIRVVVWEQDSFKYPALKTSRYFHSPISNKLEERKVDLRGKLTFQDNVCKRDKKYFEVIGNIYENKELLEDTENVR